MSNSLGTVFRITSFGESHGECVGVVVDGCPAGVSIDPADIQTYLNRRRAAEQPGATPRKEPDAVRLLSGVHKGLTTGAPLCMLIENTNIQSEDYSDYERIPRPGHADYPARIRYGGFNDPRGGGRFSGRITAGFVMAGSIARAVLSHVGVQVYAHTVAIGGIEAPSCEPEQVREFSRVDALGCIDPASAALMEGAIEEAKARGDSVGGVVECVVLGLPPGVGEPVFDGLEGEIARAVFSIPAVKGIEFGGGFALSRVRGSESNDPYVMDRGVVRTAKNDCGGMLGGLSTGMPLVVRVGIKPTPSISIAQRTVDLDLGREVELSITGRHDTCIVPRAVVVVESMVACALCDLGVRSGLIPGVVA